MDIGTIFSTILFIGPGFLIRFIENGVYANSNRFDTNEEHIVKAFIDSFFILIANLLIFKIFFKYNFFVFSYFTSKFDNICFFIKYVLVTLFTCIVYAVLIKRIISYIFRLIRNCLNCLKFKEKINKINANIYKLLKVDIIETPFPTIWDSIFNNNLDDLLGKVVTIEKDGNIISCGYVNEVPKINANSKELRLEQTSQIKAYMIDENFKKDYIDTIEFEYYDFETGTLLKCYRLVDNAFEMYKNESEKDEVLQTNE